MQGLGVLAFLVGITTFFNRSERRFRQQLSLYSAIIGVHLLLMGAVPAGMSALLNALRTLVTLRTRSQWVMVAFIVVTLAIGLVQAQHLMAWLPVGATVVSTWALFRTRGLTTRVVLWGATCCWVLHNIWVGSIGGSLIEGCFLLINGFNIVRFRRLQLRGLDPFSVEKSHKSDATEQVSGR